MGKQLSVLGPQGSFRISTLGLTRGDSPQYDDPAIT